VGNDQEEIKHRSTGSYWILPSVSTSER
jgi:hypothetical protein